MRRGLLSSAMATKYRIISIEQVSSYRQQLTARGIRSSIGFHATSRSNIASILGNGFAPSRNGYDWLGDGAYLWEDDLDRTTDWAKKRFPSKYAVVGVLLRLQGCMDLQTQRGFWLKTLQAEYAEIRNVHRRKRIKLPGQTHGANMLDCLVFNSAIRRMAVERGILVRSVREMFIEGKPAWWRSAIRTQSHIQVAVRDDSIIEGVWVLQTPEEFADADRILYGGG